MDKMTFKITTDLERFSFGQKMPSNFFVWSYSYFFRQKSDNFSSFSKKKSYTG